MRTPVSGVQFVAVGLDDPLAAPLLAELAVEYSERYGGTPDLMMTWLRGQSDGEFGPPGGGLYIGLLDGVPVTGGAFTRFDAETAELKRIWTSSRHRKRGYATALLAHLEREIAQRGYRRVYLTTGHLQPEAEALYGSAGYTRLIAPMPAEGEGAVFPIAFEKELT
ncbi:MULTISPECIES: GNAT family N-acetyltransferase [unclassified Mycolicibacterium]|uniref:GNAT family N-acetyltransferase n=1 Tax=unclassified Mycolicibacterium TaxID=2636767 RepID=UPI0012DD338C|nr:MULTISPECIES: GNAT family N-acetyltransferase [unclassified Mycolicibacterium]MUL81944.1 GNAT family N-acetyltransferase [Mycolicibacterium sp. CBMA 329]MUL87710.1 GNAT family N-acetyltransferase [Mycolicibacterium sp. CBMA 331]MUL99427.1 GNAT family N-acetyltransferase [Mycolicibacterium sp. CBMA 334]MUM29435.1 GNAT family N-acetyltransferase [Mycolicibacterium sp. CBMA 295]MUM38007.1 GNAT family N-acetyltransferase [Mycolicibacterium sp. CBMA 247]